MAVCIFGLTGSSYNGGNQFNTNRSTNITNLIHDIAYTYLITHSILRAWALTPPFVGNFTDGYRLPSKINTESSLPGNMNARDSSVLDQVRSHESASSSSNRILDRETKATTLTSISVLPEDVLIEIISIIGRPQGDVHRHGYVKRLHTMAQVCSTWASIILHTPSLWRLMHLDAQFGGTGWVTALRRSEPCRIAVECRLCSLKPPELFWSTIKKHSHRWTSLVIRAPEGSKWVKFIGVHAPYLEELSIQMSGEQLAIDRANFPNVSAISLTDVGLQDWTSGLLSGLRYLHLHLRNTSVHPPTLEQLLDVLAASPHLEKLNISQVAPTTDDTSI
ncbi:hypothetical protein FRB95_010949 [Tulasnella sp. JGI-2019a]|nr:hypothetical protein FRB95_010949 [Tulasnella sp. JGI-2019a]